MTLDLSISTDPDQPKKRASLDRCLYGTSTPNANFLALFDIYRNSHRKYGTKADVIALEPMLQRAFHEKGLEFAEHSQRLRHCYSSAFSYFLKDAIWVAFWNNITQIHHRDIQAYFFSQLGASLNKYSRGLRGNQQDGIVSLAADFCVLSNKIYMIKVRGQVDLTPVDELAIMYSQGFQLTSEDEQNEQDLWRSRIFKIQLHSSCAKDQKSYGVIPEEPAIVSSIETLLGRIHGVDYRCSLFEIANTHAVGDREFPIISTAIHRSGSSFQSHTEERVLRATYVKP